MVCTDLDELIEPIATGEMVADAEVQAHLASCEDCRALAADLQTIRDAAARLDDVRVPDGVWLQIAGRLRQQGRIRENVAAPRTRVTTRTLLALNHEVAIVEQERSRCSSRVSCARPRTRRR